jgi:hypothetical protein
MDLPVRTPKFLHWRLEEACRCHAAMNCAESVCLVCRGIQPGGVGGVGGQFHLQVEANTVEVLGDVLDVGVAVICPRSGPADTRFVLRAEK